MGVTCVHSPGEAEQLCAILNKNGVSTINKLVYLIFAVNILNIYV